MLDGDKSPAEGADKSAHSKGRGCGASQVSPINGDDRRLAVNEFRLITELNPNNPHKHAMDDSLPDVSVHRSNSHLIATQVGFATEVSRNPTKQK